MSKQDDSRTLLNRSKPNWLLRGLVIFSIGVHAVFFLHVSGLFTGKAMSYIEMSVEDVSRPPRRSIPRPRVRPKKNLETNEVRRLKTPSHAIPHFKPIKMAAMDNRFSEGLMESIALPEIPGTPDPGYAHWDPAQIEEVGGEFDNHESYLEMVRVKIEKNKSYPEKAQKRQIEGAVLVGFVIGLDGVVKEEKVVKTSRHGILDEAALRAVRDASPFARPPRRLFETEVPLTITIVFELT